MRDAVVRYGPVTAVDRVSLNVAPGEIVALLGASGSGKSSLLRAIAGLEPLAGGTLTWDGEDLTGIPVHRRGFVMMFQDGQLFPHLSVAGNVGYALNQLDRAAREARVEELLGRVGLAGYGPRPVTALSGGQAQRVALARSLAPHPRLLMLDEPLSSLDRGLREHLVGVLEQTLRATGTPALYVTHDQDEAFAIADRIAVLSGGRLLQLAPPQELWRHPASVEVAEFLGYGPILPAAEARALGWDGGVAGPGQGPVDPTRHVIPGVVDRHHVVPGAVGSHHVVSGAVGSHHVIPGSDPGSRELVALGPEALVEAPGGSIVPVLDVQPGRGRYQVSVRLPSGTTAELRTPEPPGAEVTVRIDPAECAVLASSPGLAESGDLA